jgi:hypothetical protein
MAARDKSDTAAAESGNAEVQATADDATAKGYIGEVNDPHPNDAYSIKTGPDSPPLVPDNTTRAAQPTVTKENPNA